MDLKSTFENLKDRATEMAQAGVAQSKRLAEIAKLKTANMAEEDAIKKAYIEIGKLYYAEQGASPDGAFVAACERITASKAAIAKARGAGVRVVLNTGRQAPEALWFAQEAGLDEVNACLGGAALVERTSGRTTGRRDIPASSARRVLELCLNREIELMIFAGNEILLDPFSQSSLLRTYPFPAFHQNAVLTPDPERLRVEEETVALLNAYDCKAYYTDEGAVTAVSDGKHVRVEQADAGKD